MGGPPGSDDEGRDDREAEPGRRDDPDRAAILARRQRFIALALTGLTAAACDKPNDEPTAPKGQSGQEGKADDGARPQPCLDVQVADDGDDVDVGTSKTDLGRPVPCLEVMPPPPPDDAPPQACLKIAAPPPEQPKPQPCLRVAKPPEPDPEPVKPTAKPQPCLKVAKPG
ncbi:MAG: hypothetical protein AB1Z98_11765 [Nannocystaceae bacterium]